MACEWPKRTLKSSVKKHLYYIENTLTHNTSKDVSKDESPNTDPQDDVDLYSDRINHLDEISKDIIPVIQSEELKQGNKSISKSAAI